MYQNERTISRSVLKADSKKNNVSTNITAESDECESDKQKKKKRKSNSTESVQSASEPENATTALEKPKKKKKKRDVPLADEPQEIEQGSPENLASEDANVGNMGSVMNKTAENQDTNPSQEYQPTSSSEGLDSQKIFTEKSSLEKSKKKKGRWILTPQMTVQRN
ncbi:hypothetical protein JTB14_012077 [Gonioctena quinquepunctata]|nr:hypothetical protein JTB14_012077 [Gonioctena quinquepunctata]